MTDNEDNNDNDLYDVTEEEISISCDNPTTTREEWDGLDDNIDAVKYGLLGVRMGDPIVGTFSIEGPVTEFKADVTITDDEGNTQTMENATIKSQEQVREEAKQLREEAPDSRSLGEHTSDIDEVIRVLQEAKDAGIEKVYVNDSDRERNPDPRITNNYARYYGVGPTPGELEEWVEL